MFLPRATFVLALVAAAACGRPPQSTAPPPRNIVLVTLDTLRADRLGRGIAPELDAIAAAGVQFTMARTAVPLTLPAHTTLLTGQLPPAHGVRLNGETLGAEVPTLATSLKSAGYRTAAFVGAYVLDRRFGLARGFDTYDDRVPRPAEATDTLEASRPGAAVVDAAIAWLDAVPAGPFLLWVHLYDPHAPYAAPEPWRSRFTDRPYDGEVAYAGAQVGRLLARLDTKGLTDSTIVVVAGDHGEGLNDHGESTHGMLAYDSTLRVPLIVRAPSLTPATVAVPVSLADVAVSVLQLSGAPAVLPNASTRTLRDPDPRGEVYAETTYPAVAGWHPLHVLAGATRKLIRSTTLEYYDVGTDTTESTNLAERDTAGARAAVARLSPLMTTTRAAAAPDAAALAKLRALGYASGPSSTAPRANAPNPAAGPPTGHASSGPPNPRPPRWRRWRHWPRRIPTATCSSPHTRARSRRAVSAARPCGCWPPRSRASPPKRPCSTTSPWPLARRVIWRKPCGPKTRPSPSIRAWPPRTTAVACCTPAPVMTPPRWPPSAVPWRWTRRMRPTGRTSATRGARRTMRRGRPTRTTALSPSIRRIPTPPTAEA